MTKKQQYTIRDLNWKELHKPYTKNKAWLSYGIHVEYEIQYFDKEFAWRMLSECDREEWKKVDSFEEGKAKSQEHWINLLAQVLERVE